MQKEFKQITSAINKWGKDNRNEVCFVGGFVSFNPEKKNEKDSIKGNLLIGYGCKKGVKLLLKELGEQLKKNKEHFINW